MRERNNQASTSEKNRKQIPCYWENQPGGCRKKHCPFMHKNPDARTDGIAPSQPAPPTPAAPAGGVGVGGVGVGVGVGESVVTEGVAVPQVPQPVPPAPAPVPLLWQQQRQESDNESAPSSTPTKTVSTDDAQRIARTKSQELLLLEKIQAEAAAFYSYDNLPPEPNKERKIIRTNLSTKYDRLSLDEIAGKKQQQATERRHSLDFKVLSLEEIRARKKSETIVPPPPITLNLRKRKLSTHETITTSGNKIIKMVRSNSVVYKKLDQNAPAAATLFKSDQKHVDVSVNRKRTISEQSDLYEIQDDELIDNCFEFKRIKLTEQISKPKLIRTASSCKDNIETKDDTNVSSKTDDDSDTEVQIVNVDINDKNLDVSEILDTEIIDVDSANMGEPVAIVDLSDDLDDNDVTLTELELGLVKNVPDVVASCRNNTNKLDSSNRDLLSDIEAILDDSL
ncbi:unnamed protein product [Diatraea saccharalis]|uniref:C3H1-type domain-containing protein n=1 Tax=Diatraea saccharalis TaxID=40085 RepID=A0A9N9N3X6_9NEOP|nr:unnamed protein product [Diatraea saccharalis]